MRRPIIMLPLALALVGCAGSTQGGMPAPGAGAQAQETAGTASQPAQEEARQDGEDDDAGADKGAADDAAPLYLLQDYGTGRYEVLDRDGNALLGQEYDGFERLSADRLSVQAVAPAEGDAEEYGAAEYRRALCDLSGKFLTGFDYEYMSALTGRDDIAAAWQPGRFSLLDLGTGRELASLGADEGGSFSVTEDGGYVLLSSYPSGWENGGTFSLFSVDRLLKGDTEPLWTADGAGYADPYCDAADGILVSYAKEDGAAEYRLFGPDGAFFGGRAFEGLTRFSEGLAAAEEDGLWGYLDREGNWAIPPEIRADECLPFSGGFAQAERDGLWGYIDKRGEWLMEPRYTSADPFDGGSACCEIRDGGTGKTECFLLTDGGQEIGMPGRLCGDFPEGGRHALAYSMERQEDGMYADRLWRIGADGSQEYIGSYSLALQEGSAAVLYSYDSEAGSSCGIYDIEEGKWLLEPGKYLYITDFYEPLALPASDGSDGERFLCASYEEHGVTLCDLIDFDGSVIIGGCNSISYAGDGRAVVRKGFAEGLMGFDGNWICRRPVFTSLGGMD